MAAWRPCAYGASSNLLPFSQYPYTGFILESKETSSTDKISEIGISFTFCTNLRVITFRSSLSFMGGTQILDARFLEKLAYAPTAHGRAPTARAKFILCSQSA